MNDPIPNISSLNTDPWGITGLNKLGDDDAPKLWYDNQIWDDSELWEE